MQENIQLALSIIGALSVIATLTPTPKDDTILFALKQLLNIAAGRVGGAKPVADAEVENLVKAVNGDDAKAGVKKIKGADKLEALVRKLPDLYKLGRLLSKK